MIQELEYKFLTSKPKGINRINYRTYIFNIKPDQIHKINFKFNQEIYITIFI